MFSFFKQKTAYEMSASLVGSEMCIRDSNWAGARPRVGGPHRHPAGGARADRPLAPRDRRRGARRTLGTCHTPCMRLPPALAARATTQVLELLGEPPGRVLEMGFAGIHATPLRLAGYEVVVVEPDPAHRARARAVSYTHLTLPTICSV